MDDCVLFCIVFIHVQTLIGPHLVCINPCDRRSRPPHTLLHAGCQSPFLCNLVNGAVSHHADTAQSQVILLRYRCTHWLLILYCHKSFFLGPCALTDCWYCTVTSHSSQVHVYSLLVDTAQSQVILLRYMYIMYLRRMTSWLGSVDIAMTCDWAGDYAVSTSSEHLSLSLHIHTHTHTLEEWLVTVQYQQWVHMYLRRMTCDCAVSTSSEYTCT